jgi:phosphoribosylaminoimidazole-succinocarboxamide synthase
MRAYQKGARQICGVPLPEGMKEHQRFPQPIITPTTKATEGHDMDISRDEIIQNGLYPKKIIYRLKNIHASFSKGVR